MRRIATVICTVLATGAFATGCVDSRAPTAPTQAAVGASHARDAGSPTFTSLDLPGASFTFPLDINESGVIVGRYAAAGRTHGFVRNEEGVYTTIDFPGSIFTVAASVNDSGAIAGWYILPAAPTIRHGFKLQDGAFTTVDPPGSTFTNVLGINERGDVVGRYCTLTVCLAPGAGSFHAFIYSDGEYTTIDVPGAHESDAFKIEASGTIVGGLAPVAGPEQLFVFSRDTFTSYPLPNGKSITLDNGGVNSHGDMVGSYCDAGSPCLLGPTGTHGFMLTSHGEFTPIDYPEAVATSANGINARGDVVGGWVDASARTRGYLLTGQ
jgi:uncharacterized membrane protein